MSALEENADLNSEDSGAEGSSASSSLLNGRPVMPELQGLSDDSFILPKPGTAREKVQADRRKRKRELDQKRAEKRQALAEREEESEAQEESRVQTLEREERRREKLNQGGGDLPIEVPAIAAAEVNAPAELPQPAPILTPEPEPPADRWQSRAARSKTRAHRQSLIAEPEVASTPEPVVASAPEPEVASAPEPEVASIPEPVAASAPEPEVASIPETVAASTQEPQVISAVPVPVPENGNGFHVHGPVSGNGHHFIHGNGNVVNNYYGGAPGGPGQGQGQGPEGKGPDGNGPDGKGPDGKDPQADAYQPHIGEDLRPPELRLQQLPAAPQLQSVPFDVKMKMPKHDMEDLAEYIVDHYHQIKTAVHSKISNDLKGLVAFVQHFHDARKIKAKNFEINHDFNLRAATYIPKTELEVKQLQQELEKKGVKVHEGTLGALEQQIAAAKKAAKDAEFAHVHLPFGIKPKLVPYDKLVSAVPFFKKAVHRRGEENEALAQARLLQTVNGLKSALLDERGRV